VRTRPNRRTEREAVNATRAFFEGCSCVFQEISQDNDYGKDAYVDLAVGSNVSGLCIALQIKGGVSYRRSSGYGIPIDDAHAEIWKQSSVPIAGIVYDPQDKQLRWCNITAFLQDLQGSLPSIVPVSADSVLSADSLAAGFRDSFQAFHKERMAGRALLQLTATDEDEQRSALLDCFALGRSDARMFIALRYSLGMIHPANWSLAIRLLAHVTLHPDIFWHQNNWIPEEVCQQAVARLRWSEQEIAMLINSVDPEQWQRGGSGQDVYSILCADPDIKKKMGQVAVQALAQGDEELAFWAMYLVIYWARSHGMEMYQGFLSINSEFGRLPLSGELTSILQSRGRVALFE
jgi:hypothetical protein